MRRLLGKFSTQRRRRGEPHTAEGIEPAAKALRKKHEEHRLRRPRRSESRTCLSGVAGAVVKGRRYVVTLLGNKEVVKYYQSREAARRTSNESRGRATYVTRRVDRYWSGEPWTASDDGVV